MTMYECVQDGLSNNVWLKKVLINFSVGSTQWYATGSLVCFALHYKMLSIFMFLNVL